MHELIVPVLALERQAGSSERIALSVRIDPDEGLEDLPTGAARTAPDEPVALDVTLTSFSGGIDCVGTLRVAWVGVCRRCANEARGVATAQIHERFSRTAGPADEEAYPILDDQIDLHDLIRDAVVLELPLAPLCAQDCKGLCPTCGADLNEADCGCEAPRDPRWATLDALRGLD